MLEAYFYHCSLAMSCEDRLRAFHFLANHGVMEQVARDCSSESQRQTAQRHYAQLRFL
ncbi:MAG: glutaminase [Lewinellaceae bacterium]|nr:glutaminase [Lewinellaceae bacterium]